MVLSGQMLSKPYEQPRVPVSNSRGEKIHLGTEILPTAVFSGSVDEVLSTSEICRSKNVSGFTVFHSLMW